MGREGGSFAQVHFDFDNTLTHNVKRDIGATARNVPNIWKNAKRHVEQAQSSEQRGRFHSAEKLRKTVGAFIFDIGLYKTIHPEAYEVLRKIRALGPEIRINSSRIERQLVPTAAYMTANGILGDTGNPIVSDIHFRSDGVSEEESKAQYLQDSLKELNRNGLIDARIAVIDDNLGHILAMASVGVNQEDLSKSRVLVYWLHHGSQEKQLARHHVVALPANVIPVGTLLDVYEDLRGKISPQ